jgi:ABC-type transporter Mla subunit MlaD
MRDKKARPWLTLLLGLAVALCLFVGFWSFAYQGYTEDYGSTPVQSWPYGAALFGFAGVLIMLMVRRARPDLSAARLGLIGVILVLLLFLAALGSLDAGGNSFEF